MKDAKQADGFLVGLTLSAEGDAFFNVRPLLKGQKPFSFRISRDQWAKLIQDHYRQLSALRSRSGLPAAQPRLKRGENRKNTYARRKPRK